MNARKFARWKSDVDAAIAHARAELAKPVTKEITVTTNDNAPAPVTATAAKSAKPKSAKPKSAKPKSAKPKSDGSPWAQKGNGKGGAAEHIREGGTQKWQTNGSTDWRVVFESVARELGCYPALGPAIRECLKAGVMAKATPAQRDKLKAKDAKKAKEEKAE